MNLIRVAGNRLFFNNHEFRCATGKGGFSAAKREGDGCTPVGTFGLRECWYRSDRVPAPATGLPLNVIRQDDGWSDDAKSPEYNTHVTLPYRPSHEKLWRDDHVYNLIIPMGYNDNPVVAGLGSAIFMHLAHPDYRPTEGCVALQHADLLAILPGIDTNTLIEISEN
jgi:L,D-peptidoglycan transpeptidase YkuD (ErfK/YbiS/YcfS/YnhG family)